MCFVDIKGTSLYVFSLFRFILHQLRSFSLHIGWTMLRGCNLIPDGMHLQLFLALTVLLTSQLPGLILECEVIVDGLEIKVVRTRGAGY